MACGVWLTTGQATRSSQGAREEPSIVTLPSPLAPKANGKAERLVKPRLRE